MATNERWKGCTRGRMCPQTMEHLSVSDWLRAQVPLKTYWSVTSLFTCDICAHICVPLRTSVFPCICRHSPNSSPAQVPHLWADAGIQLEPTARVCLYLPPWSCLVYYLQNRTPGKMSQIVLDIIRYFLSSGATHVHTFPTSCGVNLLTILLIMSSISRWTGWTCVKAKPQR